jgi:hypothetical protein
LLLNKIVTKNSLGVNDFKAIIFILDIFTSLASKIGAWKGSASATDFKCNYLCLGAPFFSSKLSVAKALTAFPLTYSSLTPDRCYCCEHTEQKNGTLLVKKFKWNVHAIGKYFSLLNDQNWQREQKEGNQRTYTASRATMGAKWERKVSVAHGVKTKKKEKKRKMAKTRQLSDLAVVYMELAGGCPPCNLPLWARKRSPLFKPDMQMCVNGLIFYIRSLARDEILSVKRLNKIKLDGFKSKPSLHASVEWSAIRGVFSNFIILPKMILECILKLEDAKLVAPKFYIFW